METIHVLVTMPFPDEFIDKLSNVSPRLEVVRHEMKAAEDYTDLIKGVDVLYASGSLLPQPEEAASLKWVQLHSAGVDTVLDHPLYTGTDVTFTTASGIHTVNMAEYTMAMVLAFAHRLPRMFEDRAAATWAKGRWDRYVPSELRGATLGLVGYGSIAREIARQAQGFGMRILATKRNVRSLTDETYLIPGTGDPQAEIPERIYPIQALKSFLSECDYVAVTLPLTDKTRNLINPAALAAMKPTAILINIGRGGVIDEAALIEALDKKTIGGAGLDVYAIEPLPDDSPLWKLPNVIMSPHVSGFTPYYDDRATDLFAENLRRFVVGEPLLNVVDRSRDY